MTEYDIDCIPEIVDYLLDGSITVDSRIKLHKRLEEICKLAIEGLEQEQLCKVEQEKKFEEIVVRYPPEDLCTYPEYRGKPYFSIKYEENVEHHVGFSTYNPKVLSQYLNEYFIKSESEDNNG